MLRSQLRSKKVSRSQRRSTKSKRVDKKIVNPEHPYAKMPSKLHLYFVDKSGIRKDGRYKICNKFDIHYTYKPADSHKDALQIVKWLLKHNYITQAQKIKKYHNDIVTSIEEDTKLLMK